MTVERIQCANDPRIAAYGEVADGELVRSRGWFVAEGRLVVRRVIEDGRYRVQSVLLNEAAYQSLAPLLDTLPASVPVYICATGELIAVTGFNIHRGCLALVERPPAVAVDVLVAGARTIVVLEGVANADNVGGVFRNVAALGGDGVLLSPACCDPLYRKAIRTSMGAALRVPFARAAEWPAALSQLRVEGFTLVALTPRQPSESLDRFASRPRPGRIALIVGTEGEGLTAAVEATADYRVRIPIAGGVDSLNLAVATGIALYAIRRP